MCSNTPYMIINSCAPVRICDNGGWTDTWFAKHGVIFNIGVSPNAEVQIGLFKRNERPAQVSITAENYNESYDLESQNEWQKHPLIEATIRHIGVREDLAAEILIHSEIPAGASTGTSAAICVALIAALDQLSPGRMSRHEIAYTAQKIETDILGQQCGIQDQLCSAFGGINYIEMFSYPHATISPIEPGEQFLWELERRLALIYLGKSHQSTKIHEMVIRNLENAGPECQQLIDLRKTAPLSRDALYNGDLRALGAAMVENNQAQARLHPALVSDQANRVIQIAKEHGALGWKVNGAGGDGGSLTILSTERWDVKRRMIQEIESEDTDFRNIPIRISRNGLRVWRTESGKSSAGR